MVQKVPAAPQSLAMATWRIYGCAPQRIEMPDIFQIGPVEPARGNGSRLFSVEVKQPKQGGQE
jgi:hypothetical protein